VWEKKTIMETHEMIYIFGNMEAEYIKDVNIRGYFKYVFDYSDRPSKEIRQLFGQSDILR